MIGENNLSLLIRDMNPVLNKGSYVFASLNHSEKVDYGQIIGSFKEKEGTTIIIEKELADRFNIPYEFVCAWITLEVHSSLQAVGLTAAFSKQLAEQNISCNVIAGYYHDHIFVAENDAEKSLKVLRNMQ